MADDGRLVDLPLGTENHTRANLRTILSEINTKGAGALQGTAAARPAASALLERFFYWATDTLVRSYCDGTSWITIPTGSPLADSAPPAIADSGAIGSSTDVAREDHTHAAHAFMARLNAAQVFTEDQTIEGSNNLLLGDGGALVSVGSGTAAFVVFARNAKWNGSAWVRTIAETAASRILLEENGDLVCSASSDAGATIGSTITWSTVFRINRNGDVVTTGDQTLATLKNLILGGDAGALTGSAGTGGSVWRARNAKLNAAGSAWIRTLATNNASLLEQDANGDLIYYTNSDAGNTVGSTITWSEKFKVTKAGELKIKHGTSAEFALFAGYFADTVDRFALTNEGNLSWGPGGGTARDVSLWRSAANKLTTSGRLKAENDFEGSNGAGIIQAGSNPEGVIAAPVGTLLQETTSGALYMKISGTGNTGWESLSARAKIASGSYSGDNTDNRTISLPFTPKFVYLTATDIWQIGSTATNNAGASGNQGGVVTDDAKRPDIATNGFLVDHDATTTSNNWASRVYYYVAIG